MSIFPLPLNAVEHYMLADDSADYPRLFVIVVRLRERLDESRLAAAIDAATLRHPLLRANVEYVGDRPKRWVECRSPKYSIEWRDGEPRERVVRPVDLCTEPGVRFVVQRGVAGNALICEFHHATTDGLGAIQFIGDLLAIYHANGTQVNLPTLNANRLATRDSFGLTGWRRPVRWLYGTLGWLGAIEFLAHRPAPLGELTNELARGQQRQSGFCSRTLSSEDTAAVVRTAREQQATVNDQLTREVFMSMQSLLDRHWPARSRDHLRIMVPTNLRTAGDDALPACNVVAMINIDRRPHRWTDRRKMLRVLHRELAAVKKFKLGVIFVQILETLQSLFGSLRRFLPADRCQATCVLSNLGHVLKDCDGEAISGVEFYPPVRPLTAAAIGIATHAGRLNISLRYDAAVLTAVQSDEFIDDIVNLLLRGTEATQPTGLGVGAAESAAAGVMPLPS